MPFFELSGRFSVIGMRLSMIWTGTNQIMNALIQHEYYSELEKFGPAGRDIEDDAVNADKTDEKVYE